MPHWITSDGIYYESDYKINEADIRVKPRPGPGHHYINGNWIQSAEQPYQEAFSSREESEGDFNITRLKLRMEPRHAPCEPLYCPHPHAYSNTPQPIQPTPVQQEQPQKKDGVILSESTRVMFGFRELIMVGAFVVTATISWQDTNSRIVKLEDTMSSMDLKIKALEAEHKNMEKQSRQDIQKLEQTIRDLEQVVFMKNQKK